MSIKRRVPVKTKNRRRLKKRRERCFGPKAAWVQHRYESSLEAIADELEQDWQRIQESAA